MRAPSIRLDRALARVERPPPCPGLASSARRAASLIAGVGFANYDTLYALVWGRELAHGTVAGLRRRDRPDAAPARDARRRRARTAQQRLGPRRPRRGRDDRRARRRVRWPSARSAGSSTALGAAVVRPGGRRAGRGDRPHARPVLYFGARAYVDIPYVALVLGALLVETRRPRAGAPVLALLARRRPAAPRGVAVLGRSTSRGCGGRRAGARSPLARACSPLAAPVPLGALSDLAVTGDPLHSLTGTRDTAQTLERITGLGNVPLTVAAAPRRDPARAGAARRGGRRVLALAVAARPRALGGRRRACSRSSRSACSPPPGLPILAATCCSPRRSSRSSAAPARSAGRACRAATRGAARGRGSAVATLVAARRVHARAGRPRPRAARRARAPGRDPGRPRGARARPARRDPRAARRSTVPNHRPVPLLALFLDTDPTAIVSAQEERPRRGDLGDPGEHVGRPRLHPRPARPDKRDRRRRRSGCGLAGADASWRVFDPLLRRRWTVHPPSRSARGRLASVTAPARRSPLRPSETA